jgi:hypothetical protein
VSALKRFVSADAALAAIALQSGSERPQVRLRTTNGEVYEGEAAGVDADGLSVLTRSGELSQRIPFDAIRRLEIRYPSRGREWVTAAGLATVAVAILVGASGAPVLGRFDDSALFMVLYVIAAAATPFVLARSPLGRWLRPWKLLYADSADSGA